MTTLDPLPIAPSAPDAMANVAEQYKTPEQIELMTRHGHIQGFPDSYRVVDQGRGSMLLRAPPEQVLRGNWRTVWTRRFSDVIAEWGYAFPAGHPRLQTVHTGQCLVKVLQDTALPARAVPYRVVSLAPAFWHRIPTNVVLHFQFWPSFNCGILVSADAQGDYLAVMPRAETQAYLESVGVL